MNKHVVIGQCQASCDRMSTNPARCMLYRVYRIPPNYFHKLQEKKRKKQNKNKNKTFTPSQLVDSLVGII